ncbi:MAG TPA: site-2 protease family protein [Vulgatibacter sp.]|nr:site-2 protease family protein [Vulgatibacter sp.]
MSADQRPIPDVDGQAVQAGAAAVDEATARRFPWLNLVLFLATVASTLVAGASFSLGQGDAPTSWGAFLLRGVPFSASLLGILVAHEMGHFVTARRHRVDASWPYFIPVPLGIGTFGAIIRMRGRIPTRDALVDIGASGPLAGFVVAVPLLVYGISISPVVEVPAPPNFLFGNVSLLRLVEGWMSGAMPWAHDWPMEPQPLLYVLLKTFFFSLGPGQDVMVHPVAYAAVIGLFVTALNLIPIGQLDGGHVAYAMFGRRARLVGKLGLVLLALMSLFSSAGWLVWLLLSYRFVGLSHPPVDDDRPLSPSRRLVVAATIVVFVLTLTPVSMDIL